MRHHLTAAARGLSRSAALRRARLLASDLTDALLGGGVAEPTPVPPISATFFDSFDRLDGLLGQSPSGHAWLVVRGDGNARHEALVEGGTLTCPQSLRPVVAAYAAVDLGGQAKAVRASVSFEPTGESGSAAAVIVTQTIGLDGIDHIVRDGSIHLVFTDRMVKVGLFRGGDNFQLRAMRYPKRLAHETVYEVGADIDGDRLTVYVPGASLVLRHPRIEELAGRFVTFEPYQLRGQCRPRFHHVAAV